MSIYVVRAFIRMRQEFVTSAAILKRLAEIDRKLLMHDVVLRDLYRKLQPLLSPPPTSPRREIGFHVKPKEPEPAKGFQCAEGLGPRGRRGRTVDRR